MKFVLYFAIGWCVLLAVAGIALPVEPVEPMEIEVLESLKGYVEHQLEEGRVRVVDGSELISLRGSKGERILGVPRLEYVGIKGAILSVRLIQTWLPAARLEVTVEDFNNLAFHLGFVDVVWETSCNLDTAAECYTSNLVRDFLKVYGNVPEAWPGDDDEWAFATFRGQLDQDRYDKTR